MIGSVLILVKAQAELLRNFLKSMHINIRSSRWVFRTFRWVVIIPLFYFVIACIYKYGPAIRKRWKLFSPGTMLATFLTILTTLLFSYWVNRFGSYNKVYGSIGTIMILMLLISLYPHLVLLIGYELNVSIHHVKEIARRASLAQARK